MRARVEPLEVCKLSSEAPFTFTARYGKVPHLKSNRPRLVAHFTAGNSHMFVDFYGEQGGGIRESEFRRC